MYALYSQLTLQNYDARQLKNIFLLSWSLLDLGELELNIIIRKLFHFVT